MNLKLIRFPTKIRGQVLKIRAEILWIRKINSGICMEYSDQMVVRYKVGKLKNFLNQIQKTLKSKPYQIGNSVICSIHPLRTHQEMLMPSADQGKETRLRYCNLKFLYRKSNQSPDSTTYKKLKKITNLELKSTSSPIETTAPFIGISSLLTITQ